jgi:hypothetical protein
MHNLFKKEGFKPTAQLLYDHPVELWVYLLFEEIQVEHKRTLHFQNDTENKCSAFRTSHPHQSIELSKFLFQIIWVIVIN